VSRLADPLLVPDEKTLTSKDFGALFKGFLEEATTGGGEAPFFARRLGEHFGQDATKLPTLSENVEKSDQPNLHLAIEAYLAEAGRRAELIGFIGADDFREPSISGLLTAQGYSEGSVEYANIALANDAVLPSVTRGLFLISEGEKRHVLLLAGPGRMNPYAKFRLEVMTPDHRDAVKLLGALRASMRKRNVYRGHIVSLSFDGRDGAIGVDFHRLRPIERDQIILPEGLLERIERQTIGFSRHREALLSAGRHLKRGLLLYGPPGTGKTFTAMYLASQMKERTTFLLTGGGFGLIGQSCAMARALQPSTVILEDVDLVAEERTRQGSGCTALLFELLNQMDGLSDDADVVFILTTNRPEILEPALASRPGRVDLAVEVPVPDAECRRRLIALYARGLTLRVGELDRVIQRTEGVSAAFIRELLRKAALFSIDEAGDGAVEDRHLDAALHELVVQGGQLTRSLLGVRSK
jgi:hypothetical protein